MQLLLLVLAIVIGHFFAYVDSRPNFDDAGILAISIAIISGMFTFIHPKRPWLWALAVGVWIPLHNWIHNGSLASLLALVFAFAGAYLAAAAARFTRTQAS